jgi:hypothetical protein
VIAVDLDDFSEFTWLALDGVLWGGLSNDATDPMEVFVDEQRSMERIEEAEDGRNRKLASIGTREVFPAGIVILQDERGHRTKRNVIVAVTSDDLVVLNAEVRRDPEGEIGRIRKADVVGVRMVDEAGNRIAMTQSRDVLELDEPERSYIVAVDRREGDATVSQAFVFRSLSVADEARRDFERNLAKSS